MKERLKPYIDAFAKMAFVSDNVLPAEHYATCAAILTFFADRLPQNSPVLQLLFAASPASLEAADARFMQAVSLFPWANIYNSLLSMLEAKEPFFAQVLRTMKAGFFDKPWEDQDTISALKQLDAQESATIDDAALSTIQAQRRELIEVLNKKREAWFQENIPPLIHQVNEYYVKDFNRTHDTHVQTREEADKLSTRWKLEEGITELTQRNPQLHARQIQEFILRNHHATIFSRVLAEDILVNKTELTSPALRFLDILIKDYINPNKQGVWKIESERNFGYEHQHQEQLKKFTENDFFKMTIDKVVDIFDEVADDISLHRNTIAAGFYLTDLSSEEKSERITMLHALWLSRTKLAEENVTHYDSKTEIRNIDIRYSMVWYFEHLLIKQEIDKNSTLAQEVESRLAHSNLDKSRLPFNILKDLYSLALFDEEDIMLKIRGNFNRLVNDFFSFVDEIIVSRTASVSDFLLTFGIGCEGWAFNYDSTRKEKRNFIYLNFSNSYRRPQHIIFLNLVKDHILAFFRGNFKETSLFHVKVLAVPELIDEKIHAYIFKKILHLVYTQENAVSPEIGQKVRSTMGGMAKNEISMLKNRIKRRQSQSKTDHPDNEDDRTQITILNSIVDVMSNFDLIANNDVLRQLNLLIDTGLRSICIESLISRHSHANNMVSVTFRPDKKDILKIGDEIVKFGNAERRIIPPCSHFCQLFAASHMLWAELTDQWSLTKVNILAQAQGRQPVIDRSAIFATILHEVPGHILEKLLDVFQTNSDLQSAHQSNDYPIAQPYCSAVRLTNYTYLYHFLGKHSYEDFLIERRHQELHIQHAYDQRFGLTKKI